MLEFLVWSLYFESRGSHVGLKNSHTKSNCIKAKVCEVYVAMYLRHVTLLWASSTTYTLMGIGSTRDLFHPLNNCEPLVKILISSSLIGEMMQKRRHSYAFMITKAFLVVFTIEHRMMSIL